MKRVINYSQRATTAGSDAKFQLEVKVAEFGSTGLVQASSVLSSGFFSSSFLQLSELKKPFGLEVECL